VQDEWNIAKDWTLTGGVRRDQYSDFGGTTNPRIALVWDASLELTAKVLYGSAFRAPSFNEQYGVNPVASGNPSVRPETIKTLETALQWQANKDLQFNMSVFRYEMEDIIRTTPNPAPAPGSTFQNAGAQRGHGAELEFVWDARRSVRFTGHYAYQRSTDKATGADAGYTPHHHFYARSDWTFASGWLLSGQLNHVADRKRTADDPRPPVADYTTLDLTLRSNRGKQAWELAGSVRNLFNADVREPSLAPGASLPNDLPMPRRSLYLQAAYRF
jgi:iron complex outermembrane receptor protein